MSSYTYTFTIIEFSEFKFFVHLSENFIISKIKSSHELLLCYLTWMELCCGIILRQLPNNVRKSF